MVKVDNYWAKVMAALSRLRLHREVACSLTITRH